MNKWKKETLENLRIEAVRLIKSIDEAVPNIGEYENRSWASVKRASLDLNVEGVKLRKGYWNRDKS